MPSQSKEAVELYNLGLNLAQQNRYEDAIAPLTEALEADKNYNNAYNLLGKVYIHLGDVQLAQECWMEVLKRDAFNSTAMACLEASSPKRPVEHLRDMMPIIMVLVFVIGSAFVYFSIRKLDSRMRSMGTVSIIPQSTLNPQQPSNESLIAPQSISKPTSTTSYDSPERDNSDIDEISKNSGIDEASNDSDIAETSNDSAVDETSSDLGISQARAGFIDVEPDFGNTKSQSNVAKETTSVPLSSQTDFTQDLKPTQVARSSSPPKPRVLVPTTTAELEARYSKAIKLYLQDGKYTQALREFQILTQSSLSHRWVIGNAHYWAGICYLRLNQPNDARAEFQKVTKRNSYKYEEATGKIRVIEAE